MAEQTRKAEQGMGVSDKYEHLTETEWLLTNKRGGFCCGTVSGTNTRRYHSLLTGSLTPPAQRIVALSGCVETVHIYNRNYNLNHFEFEPPSPNLPRQIPAGFRKDAGVHFDYHTAEFKLTKSIYMLPESDIVAICYDFRDIEESFDFVVRPLTAMRDYHAVKRASEDFCLELSDDFLVVKNKACQGQLILSTEEMTFTEQRQWWNNFLYRQEKTRGYDCIEDLFSPGIFRRTINGPVRIVLWAGFGGADLPQKMTGLDVDVIIDDIKLQQRQVLSGLKSKDPVVQALAISADEFIIDRQIDRVKTKSILAGFPWFMDWGRDAFIAFEGLLLNCGRYEDAASVLLNFAYNADDGMIPNCFGDYNSGAQFNSIDSSLWFIHAAFAYYKASGDARTFTSKLMPIIRWIIDSYGNGTKFNIRADYDGLITGGAFNTQLTWMDAKIDNTVVTPRHGKAVEINALWYNSICNIAEFYRVKDAVAAKKFSDMADRVANSFRACFWNEAGQCLYDCVTEELKDSSIRPNQIFSVSLPFSPLTAAQQKAVVDCVQRELLTPFGLRTLSPKDNRYKGRYEGNTLQRDSAYHQGTVWPWLIGAFIEAYLKVNNNSRQSKKNALAMLEPLLNHFHTAGCIGSISEVFDGDAPHKPGGAFAQAWSVAEVLRAYLMVNS
ncbi:MAG: amylo-alpha-1,6-glucosidase [Phycisphaerae bacterium]|nr:amylo-alpha-1,6-glucosidase [Phycisphaerae bacterium]